MRSTSLLPLAAVLVSPAAAVLIGISSRRPNLREAWTILAAVAKLGIVLVVFAAVLDGRELELVLLTVAPGIDLVLRADALGSAFALSAAGLWLLTSLYSIGYVRALDEPKQTRYHASFAVCLGATIGIAFAGNLFTLFVFYELLTLATYPLVAHKETPEAVRAARKYLAYLLTGGLILLVAVALAHAGAGTPDFRAGGYLGGELAPAAVFGLFLLFLLGFGTKAAVVPLHGWLPAAMVAPTPVSALLHAVAVVKAGVFGMSRGVGFVIGPEAFREAGAADLLGVLAVITLVAASLAAIAKDSLKERLAYSTVAHLSYILLGLSLLSATAWTGSLFHIVNHAVMKITLFFCAGAIYVQTRHEKVSELDGLGRRMPVTMGAFALASLGVIGIPPMGGFWSKWFLILGSFETHGPVFAAGLLLSGLLSAAYLLPVVHRTFFRAAPGDAVRAEAPMIIVVPLATTAVLSLVLGLGDTFGFFSLSTQVADAVVGGTP